MHRGKRTQSLCFGGLGADQKSYNWYAVYRVVSPKNHRHSGSSSRHRSSSGSTWGSKGGSGNNELAVINNNSNNNNSGTHYFGIMEKKKWKLL